MLEKILQEIEEKFDERINAQLKIMAGLADEGHRYGYGKALEAYQQSKLLVEDIIRSHMEDEPVSNPDKLGDDGWIPCSERLPEDGIEKLCKNVGKRAGLQKSLTVHVFRRTFATRLANQGCPLETIQALMGHVKAETTQRYIARSQERVVQAASRYFKAA